MCKSGNCNTLFITLLLCLAGEYCPAQQTVRELQQNVQVLCDSFEGRGYVNMGSEKAAAYLSAQFESYGLSHFSDQSYLFPYSFSVNTFPDCMEVSIDGNILKPGIDYLVHPGSNGLNRRNIPVEYTDVVKGAPPAPDLKAHLLLHLDSLLKREGGITERQWLSRLGNGVYLVPRTGKPLWWVATDTISATVIYLYDTLLLNRGIKNISVNINNRFIPKYPVANIVGYIPGTECPDSFLVITAHYDHLGKMGTYAVFPGASDNASGTAMLLSLARYYSRYPLKYSVAFLLFSGEEAGLLGSSYYVQHPLFPLENIRFLLNMDIMGDATDGITVVNGSIHREAFDLLKHLNGQLAEPLPGIHIRGAAANSDHYPFSEAGIPAIFIYSNGGKGFYHDTWDRPETLSYKNVPALRQLLIEFISRLGR